MLVFAPEKKEVEIWPFVVSKFPWTVFAGSHGSFQWNSEAMADQNVEGSVIDSLYICSYCSRACMNDFFLYS